MTTSFDTPRVFGHHNPFASFQDTTDDPLATTTSTNNSTSGFGGSAGGGPNSSTDPWSSYYIPPVASTSSHNAPPSSALSNVVDEEAIPELYTQAWNAALTSSSSTTTGASFGSTFNTGNTISLGVLQRVLSGCAGLGASETEKIINLVSGSSGNLAGSYANIAGSPTSPFRTQSGGSTSNGRIAKLEFYIALALAALSQNREAVTIQAVASRRDNLPIPKLDLSSLHSSSTFTNRPGNARNASSSNTPYRAHKMSLGSQSDPWGSTNEGSTSATVNVNGQSSSQSNHHQEDPFTASPSRYSHTSTQPPMYSPPRGERIGRSTDQNGYSSFPRYNEEDEDGATIGGSGTGEASTSSYTGGGYPSSGTGRSSSSSDSTLFNLPRYTTAQQLYNSMERIKVIQSDELQGNFLTRHTVYKVIQEKKGIEVLRRYSDWVALNDYLEGKYAGRIRLALPPKRVGISARHVHIASDEQFLLRRRRGLSRYLNVLINHPIYKHDKIVSTFFNNDQSSSSIDFSAYKKIHQNDQFVITEGINDEASLIGKLSTSQESLIPISTTFESILSTLRESLPGLIESLTRLCALIERINYRSLQNQSDLMRARLSFDSFAETYKGLSNGSHHASRPREIEEETTILNRDLNHLSDKIGIMNELTESHVGNFENEIILEERMKLQRDLWRSLLVLLTKYESKLKHDNIDKIKKRIEGYQSKYSTINNTPISNRKANADEEMKKLVKNIEDDQNEIERLFNRRVFYEWSILAEVRFVWRWSTVLRVDLADLASEENKFYSQISRIWAGLDDALSIDT